MPYATNGQISTAPIEGGIEITQQQYQDALAAMLEGKEVAIEDGQMVLRDPPPQEETQPEPEDPATPVYPVFAPLELLELFNEGEQLAVVAATMSNAAIKLWYDKLLAASFITYEDPRTEAGLQALVDNGLLTPERKAEIVAAMQPQELLEQS
jgi:hypothetical protein